MKQPGIHIEKISVRLSGVTARQAGQRAASIAREVARTLAADPRLRSRGTTAIDKLAIRLPARDRRHE